MKHLLKLLVVIIPFFIFSCSSDDSENNSQNPSNSIVGTWIISTLESELPLDVNADGTASASLHLESDCIIEQITFYEDGTFDGETQFALQFLAELQNVLCLENSRNGTWELNNNSLSMMATGVNFQVDIVLTENTLSYDLLGGYAGIETTTVIGTYLRQ